MLASGALVLALQLKRRKARPMKPQRLAVQAAALQKNPAEAEVVLRMSVIANAMISLGRMMDRPSAEMISASDQRDLVCHWILFASYLKEAVPILNKRHNGLAWKLAAAGVSAGVTLPPEMPLDRLKSLMAENSEFVKTCVHIRDKFAFHADPEPVMDWLKSRPALEGVGMMAQFGPHVEDIVFDAAAFSIFEAGEKMLMNDFEKTLSEVVLAVPYLIEAMIRGLIKQKALTLEAGEKDGEQIVFAYEPGTTF